MANCGLPWGMAPRTPSTATTQEDLNKGVAPVSASTPKQRPEPNPTARPPDRTPLVDHTGVILHKSSKENAMSEIATLHRRAAVSNPKVAKRLGLHFTMASRLRSGARLPSIFMMVQIEKEFGWAISDQVKARTSRTETYHEVFESILINEYGSE